ncbi:hypothetical protein QJS04_geneDACA020839 [Acorus gramineus]|uniref:Exo_endo_phos domain-containing protein n=1 Tax=Acorus gramineus TaxID=55184 RepID=A0AAV9BL60_ACOGR|nr:hypothetical protein QJS04_geneDACA020839 [Acorus gramineus]
MLSGVYGPHDDSEREALWSELSMIRTTWDVPWCVVGDFNVTRFASDRNREAPNTTAMHRFSEWIDNEGLLDLPLSNQAFTWNIEEIIHANWGQPAGILEGAKRLAYKLRRLKRCLMAWSGLARRKRVETKAHSMEGIAWLDGEEILFEEALITDRVVAHFQDQYKKDRSWRPTWADQELSKVTEELR